MSGVLIILHEISVLFQKASQIEASEGGLDLRWTITAIMGELIEWCKNHADDQRFSNFIQMIQAISKDQIKKGDLMLDLEELDKVIIEQNQ